MGVLCAWVKLLSDLQILGCGLHKNAFGGRAPSFSAPPDPLDVMRRMGGRGGQIRVGNREGGGRAVTART